MNNKTIYIKNAKEVVDNIKNNLIIAKIANKNTKEYYKGDN